MYIVYILRSGHKLYKGMTNNVSRRLAEHRRGKTKTTKGMIDIKLVYSEQYDNFADARNRELYFKTAAGRRFIKNVLKV